MRRLLSLTGIAVLLASSGCALALIGAGAAGGYKVGTDERSVGQMMDDGAISTRVKAALINDPQIEGRKIDVDTLHQVVALTGTVQSPEQAQRAVRIAGSVSYVKDVKSFLQVGDKTIGQSLDDKMIWSKVKGKLIREKGVRSLNIDVDVTKGVVTLTGVVPNAGQRERLFRIARATRGVVAVTDNMTIQGESE